MPMNLQLLLPVVLLFILFFLKIPVAFSLLTSAVYYFLFFNNSIPPGMLVQKIVATTESFTYLAIPFFVCAGVVFNYSGITTKIIDLAELLVGHFCGGMGQVNILASTLMGGLSGSSNADAAMDSKMIVPEMIKRGYSRGFSTAVTAASSCITPIIPPGIILIMYAMVANVSVAKMFLAGYVPGFIMCVTLMVVVWWISKKRGYAPSREKRAPLKLILQKTLEAIWALILPFGLLLGLRFGMFTPTEGGAMAVAYALIIGVFVYKEIKWKHVWPIIKESVEGTAGVIFIIAAANSFSLYLAWERIPMIISEIMINSISDPIIMMLCINFFLLICGCFFEGGAALILLGPLLIPTVQKMGIDLVHFGIILSINLTMGGITPPFGSMMFVTTTITQTPLEEYVVESIPFIAALIGLLVLFTFTPSLILFVPRLFGM
ncbi:C4-dicarboxylate ABC transporter [Synergistales bacterium]|nr:C4-dicarboxylate ABC transporter [Synergistales bacterium]